MRSLKSLIFLLSAICLSILSSSNTFVSATTAGVAMAMDVEIFNQLKSYGMPAMITMINDLDMGKMEFSQGYVDDVKFNLKIQDMDTIKMSFSGEDNAIIMKAEDISGSVSGTFKFTMLFITASGKFNVRVDQGGCTMGTKMPFIIQNQDGRNIPGIDVVDFEFEINSSKIHIDLSGGFIADIADPFIAIFKSLIIGKMNSSVRSAIPEMMKKKLNTKFANTQGLVHFKGDLFGDFTFTSPAVITDTTLAMYLNGTIFDQKLGQYRIPQETSTDVEVQTTSSNTMQMSVSPYSADSILVSMHDTGLFDYVITKETVPGLANILTTNYMDGLLPGIVAKYGRDQEVTIEMKATQAPRTEFKLNDLGMFMNLDLTFRVNQEVAIIVTLTDLKANVKPMLIGANFTAQIYTIKIDECSATQSQIGDFDGEGFRDFFNVSVRIAIPFLNEIYMKKKAIVMPDTFMGFIKVKSATFSSQDGFLAVTVYPKITDEE
eukprot:403363197